MNPSYEPEADFIPQPDITLEMAIERSKHYGSIVRSKEYNIETGRYEWECLNYYNQIILKSKIKQINRNHENKESES